MQTKKKKKSDKNVRGNHNFSEVTLELSHLSDNYFRENTVNTISSIVSTELSVIWRGESR